MMAVRSVSVVVRSVTVVVRLVIVVVRLVSVVVRLVSVVGVIVRDGGEVGVSGGGGTQGPTEDSSLSQEELEATQPLVLNTTPIFDVLPNVENLQMEETTLIRAYTRAVL